MIWLIDRFRFKDVAVLVKSGIVLAVNDVRRSSKNQKSVDQARALVKEWKVKAIILISK